MNDKQMAEAKNTSRNHYQLKDVTNGQVVAINFTNDWYEITDIYRKFGIYVASWASLHTSVYRTENIYPVIYNNWRTTLEQNGFSEQTIRTCFKLINPHYPLILFDIHTVDVVRLDSDIKTPDNTSTKDHVINLYGLEVAKAIECLI